MVRMSLSAMISAHSCSAALPSLLSRACSEFLASYSGMDTLRFSVEWEWVQIGSLGAFVWSEPEVAIVFSAWSVSEVIVFTTQLVRSVGMGDGPPCRVFGSCRSCTTISEQSSHPCTLAGSSV